MKSYRTLSADLIVRTLARLEARISERFPERGLVSVARELLEIAEKDGARAQRFLKPYVSVRIGVFLLIVAGAAGQAGIVWSVIRERVGELQADFNVFNIFQGVDAALNTLLLMGAGILFLTTLEERLKRRVALKDLHELRSIAHVIDMHQLTKDPVIVLNPGLRTKSSPAREMSLFELSRYLDYCAELLALTSKLAALYAQSTRDSVVIQAVNEIEDLTTALSGKIWQKIVLVRAEADAPPAPIAPAPAPKPVAAE